MRKNVAGVLSADPRVVPDADTVHYLDFEEAAESGKVVCTKALVYLQKNSTACMEVRYIRDASQKTIIQKEVPHENRAKILSWVPSCCLLKISSHNMIKSGYLYKLSKLFADTDVNMVLIRNGR